jgi:hypothetical protein
MLYEPKISWSPVRRFELSFQSAFRYGRSVIGGGTRLPPLRNIVQKLQLSGEIAGVDVLPAVEHYYSDVSRDQSVHAFFADLLLRRRTGRWVFELSGSNLFNGRTWRYTEYSTTQSCTSWIRIRGREWLLSIRYAFR